MKAWIILLNLMLLLFIGDSFESAPKPRVFKKMKLPGTVWPTMIYRSVQIF